MYHSSEDTVNGAHGSIARTYLEEYRHLGPLQDAPASHDFKTYMTTSLIRRGILFENSKNINELYRASLEELFSNQFKNIFLYDPKREITGIYTGIENVKNMGPVGTHDMFASLFGLIPAKYLPVFEPFDYDFKNDESIDVEYTPEEKRIIILSRGIHDDGTAFNYTKLTAYDRMLGPNLGTTYFTHPKLPNSTIYNRVDTIATPNVDPNTKYFIRVDDTYIETHDFDTVEEFNRVESAITPDFGRTYYKKTKNPNTVNFIPATGIPDLSTQYFIKDPANEDNYIIADVFNDRKDYVLVNHEMDHTDSKYPIVGMDYFKRNENREYVKCNEEDFAKEYEYAETADSVVSQEKTYYIKNIDDTYRPAVTEDFLHEDITEEHEVDSYNEVLDKSAGPQPGTTYYVKNEVSHEYVAVDPINLPTENIYSETQDLAYDESKSYYIKNADGVTYRPTVNEDFNRVENTTEQMVDNFVLTEDETYNPDKEYFNKNGDDYVAAEFEETQTTVTTQENVYNPTEDVDYDESKTYYISDGDGGFIAAEDTDFDIDVDIKSFKADVTYYELTVTTKETPGQVTTSFKDDLEYYEKVQVPTQVPNGTFDVSFKDDVTYYEITGTKTIFEVGIIYYTKSTGTDTVVIGQNTTFDPDLTYYERISYKLIFADNIDYYTLEVVGKLFVPTIQYYTKQVIDNGYKYEEINDFDIHETYELVDKSVITNPDTNETYYVMEDFNYVAKTNLLTWESDKEYYTKVITKTFKADVEYYSRETVTKFKVASLDDPSYIYYTAEEVDNGYDETKYVIADVANGFEDIDYYTADIDFENTTLTDEEMAELRKKKVINKLNQLFDYYVKDVLTTAREIFIKHDIYEITKSVNMEASDYELHAIRILYKKILQVIYTMVYTVNVSADLDDTCIPYKLLRDSVVNLLANVKILGEMISTKHYYSKKVLSYFIPDSKKEEVWYRYTLVSPFSDLVTIEDQTVTIDEMTMKLTENIINYRSLLERTDIINETDMQHLFGLFTMTYNIMVQLFFNSAYTSKNKQPLVNSVTDLFKRFTPNYNNIINGESIKKFVNLTE